MKLSALIQPLIAAKVPHEQIMQVVLAFEAQQVDALEQRRKSDAERQARKREREAMSRDVTLRHSDRSLTGAGDTRGLEKTSSTDRTSEERKEKTRSPREMLETVLSPDRAGDVLEMRQRIKAPLTARAAELLARELAKWPIPDEAADEMVQRAWRGFKPEWMNGAQVRAGPAPKRTEVQVADELLAQMRQANAEPRTEIERHQASVISIPFQRFG